MHSANHLPFGMSCLGNRGNLHTQCWCSLVDILVVKGTYCVKVFLIIVWMHPDCSNCCGQLVTPNAIQQISYL